MNNNPIFSDNSKGQQKKIIAMIVGIVFFFICARFLMDSDAISRFVRVIESDFNVDISGFFTFLGVLSYGMCALGLLGIPVIFITAKSGWIALYDWGVEGVGRAGNPFKPTNFRFAYNQLLNAKCQNDIVQLMTSQGKYTYSASNKTAAAQIINEINNRAGITGRG